jgi:hypothetical protein
VKEQIKLIICGFSPVEIVCYGKAVAVKSKFQTALNF